MSRRQSVTEPQLREALRQARGAFGSAQVAKVKHGRRPRVSARIRRALRLLHASAEELCAAVSEAKRR